MSLICQLRFDIYLKRSETVLFMLEINYEWLQLSDPQFWIVYEAMELLEKLMERLRWMEKSIGTGSIIPVHAFQIGHRLCKIMFFLTLNTPLWYGFVATNIKRCSLFARGSTQTGPRPQRAKETLCLGICRCSPLVCSCLVLLHPLLHHTYVQFDPAFVRF